MTKIKKKSINKNKNNSRLNNIIIGNNTDNILNIKPSFPPKLTTNDLIKDPSKPSTSNRRKTFPNAFIAYRTALMNEYRKNNRKLPPMGKLSKIAKNSWVIEPKHVKDFYDLFVMEAKSNYKQNNIQIVFDKHVANCVENNQESERVLLQTYSAEFDHLPVETTIYTETSSNLIQDSAVNHNNNVNLTHISLINSFSNPETNSTQEYIRIMEREIDSLKDYIRMMEREIDSLKDYIKTLEQVNDSLLPRN